ncbi:hypothetical protein QR98_0065540 [Sarcoptes scabiei]|uniref:Uncharacterized protein n=1 Tax=Sarcoptes scabiei TaxID=52283 RepID=A0A132AAL9_SARSC|nr:hypothetical protein QR98_0065540 [Sarcoptes scabiei]
MAKIIKNSVARLESKVRLTVVASKQKCSRRAPIKPAKAITIAVQLTNANWDPETPRCVIAIGANKPVMNPASPRAMTAALPATKENFRQRNALFLSIAKMIHFKHLDRLKMVKIRFDQSDVNKQT